MALFLYAIPLLPLYFGLGSAGLAQICALNDGANAICTSPRDLWKEDGATDTLARMGVVNVRFRTCEKLGVLAALRTAAPALQLLCPGNIGITSVPLFQPGGTFDPDLLSSGK